MAQSSVKVERRDALAVLTLEQRAWRSVDVAQIDDLVRACDALRDDASVRAVIITGVGQRFCGDWSRSVSEQAAQRSGAVAAAFQPVASLPQPVIAAVNGPAYGAALELALAADVRIATETASFVLCDGESLPMAGGLTRLSRAVGRATATWMALTGACLTATDARAAGLVSDVRAADELLPEAERLARVMASRGPLAVRYAKEAITRGMDLTLAHALRVETDLTIILQTTADRAEGVAAFTEKREPTFRGQ